jgi:hypothetical protein
MQLREIFKLTTNNLYTILIDELRNFGYNRITFQKKRKNYIAAEGDIPVVLVAHLDTVFDDAKTSREDMSIFYDQEKKVWWSPNGLGADDRVGVYMILKLLEETTLRPHIIFTTGEETGGIGAFAVADDKNILFDNVSYFIELDRQGYKESVYYDCDNKDFEKYINSFGFKTHDGTFTDISIICPDWEICGVNLSVGYWWEHSYIEHFYEAAWKDTFKKLIMMLEDKAGYSTVWKYVERPFPMITEKELNLLKEQSKMGKVKK